MADKNSIRFEKTVNQYGEWNQVKDFTIEKQHRSPYFEVTRDFFSPGKKQYIAYCDTLKQAKAIVRAIIKNS